MPLRPGTARPIYPLELLWRQITSAPAALPDTAVVSLPIPGPQPQTLCGLFYQIDPSGLIIPVARVSGSARSGERLSLDDWFPNLPPIYRHPRDNRPPNALYSDYYLALQAVLLLAPSDTLMTLLAQLEPDLLPFYRALNPDFFK